MIALHDRQVPLMRLRCSLSPTVEFFKVYAGVFPVDTNDFIKLEESIKRVCFPFEFLGWVADSRVWMIRTQLTLTDRSVSVQRETSTALGQGLRLGFLGTLHMDVFRQRFANLSRCYTSTTLFVGY